MTNQSHSSATLTSRRLYIEHLARAIEAKETGRITLCPTAYRLCTRRLQSAIAGYPEAVLVHTLTIHHSAVVDALENLHFEAHWHLPGAGGKDAKRLSDGLLARLAAR